eukprot:scpid36743/ scgid26909/ 
MQYHHCQLKQHSPCYQCLPCATQYHHCQSKQHCLGQSYLEGLVDVRAQMDAGYAVLLPLVVLLIAPSTCHTHGGQTRLVQHVLRQMCAGSQDMYEAAVAAPVWSTSVPIAQAHHFWHSCVSDYHSRYFFLVQAGAYQNLKAGSVDAAAANVDAARLDSTDLGDGSVVVDDAVVRLSAGDAHAQDAVLAVVFAAAGLEVLRPVVKQLWAAVVADVYHHSRYFFLAKARAYQNLK